MHYDRAIVAQKAGVGDGPSGALPLNGEQSFACGDVKAITHGLLTERDRRAKPQPAENVNPKIQSSSSSRQRLHDINGSVGGHAITQVVWIRDRFAVDEDRHVLAKSALIVQYIAAGLLIAVEVFIEHRPQGCSGHLSRRAGNVPLDVLRESNLGHGLGHH